MRVFVDESGDTAMHGSAGSSTHFVVTAVIFTSAEEAQQCSQRLDALKIEFGLQPTAEFKFSELAFKYRIQFLKTVAPFNFTYCTVILDKQKLDGKGFKFHKSFYKYPIRMLFRNARRYLTEATVCVDRSGDKHFSSELERYLKQRVNIEPPNCPIKELVMEDSRSENLLQLADMICGAIARSLKADKPDHRKYRPIILHKEAGFQKFPTRRRVQNKKIPTRKRTA